jgi:hypothetical protein
MLLAALVHFACLAAADELSERQEMKSQVTNLFFAEDFKTLETVAAEFRTQRTRSPSGVWRLTTFYYAFNTVLPIENKDEIFWDRAKAISDRWVRQFPESPTSHVVRGIVLKLYAWKFRGGGYASTVSADSWPVFFSKLAEAREYLQRTKEFGSTDPQWYDVMADIAVAEGWESAEFEKLLEEGLTREPLYYQLYFTAVNYFTPKWGGDPTKIEAFANAAVKRTQKEEGSSLYARIYWVASQIQYGAGLFSGSDVVWDQMKHGIHDVLARYPDQWNINNFAYFACLARDRDETRRLMQMMADYPIMAAWRNPETFSRCMAFAR